LQQRHDPGAMIVQVTERCTSGCGAVVVGDVDSETREFIHRFRLPRGAEDLVSRTRTEVDGVRLVTFGPDAEAWFVDCPVCRSRIAIPHGGRGGAGEGGS
jgi:hypothetical protein